MMERRWLVAASCITLLLTACGSPKSKQDIAEELKETVVTIDYMDTPGVWSKVVASDPPQTPPCVTRQSLVTRGGFRKPPFLRYCGVINWGVKPPIFQNHQKSMISPLPPLPVSPRPRVSLFTDGTVSGIEPPIVEGYRLFYDATTAKEMSWGPVVNVDGKAIGVPGPTDTEIIRIASSQKSSLSPEQRTRVSEIKAREENQVPRINNFKWGVPINIYLQKVQVNPPTLVESPVKLPIPKGWLLGVTVGGGIVLILCRQLINYSIWEFRGLLLEILSLYSEAIASYDKAIDIKPDLHYAWDNRGDALMHLERYSEAIASYEKVIDIKPDYHYAWHSRGLALYKLQRYLEAIASFEEAIKIKPNYSYSWNNRGMTLYKLQRYLEAIASFEKAIKIKPVYHEAWYNRGNALMEVQRKKDAIASFEKAIEIKPDDHEACNNRGVALEDLERYDEALESYNRAIKFDPNNQVVINNRKLLLEKLGRPTQ